jgi:hypothetical protein
MDDQRFDTIARAVAAATSRRSLLRAIAGGIGGGALVTLGRWDEASAQACAVVGEECGEDADCCDDLVCTEGTCQEPAVCAGEGEACEEDGDCCAGICCVGACRDIECCIDEPDPNARCPEGTSCFEGVCDPIDETGATVTIHKAECPTGTGDIFGECHDNALGGVAFSIGGANVTTGDDGVAGATVAVGTVTVTEDAGTLGNYLGAYVYCAEQNSGTVLYDASADTGSVSFAVADGDDVVCDWYNITEADEDEGDDGGSTSLPATGSGPIAGTSGTPWLPLALAGGAAAALARRLRSAQ